MSFSDHKITSFTHKIADLPDQPNLQADELKARFDSSPEELRAAHNAVCDDAARLEARVEGIVVDTFGDTIDKEMLSDELAAELDAKAEAADLTAEVTTRASADAALDTRVTALESEVPQKAEVYYTTYNGTGGARNFTLGFTPKLVIVTCSDYNDCAPAAPLAVPQGKTVYYNSYALATLSGNTLSIKETGGRNLTGHSYAILAVV